MIVWRVEKENDVVFEELIGVVSDFDAVVFDGSFGVDGDGERVPERAAIAFVFRVASPVRDDVFA